MPYVIRLHTGKIVGEHPTKGEALDVMRKQRIEGARAIFVAPTLGKDRFVMLHTITVKNHSKLSESDVSQMVRAIRVQVANDFCPAYGLRTVDIMYSPPKAMPSKGTKLGVLLLVDDEYADPDALGHKTEEKDGTVYAVLNVGAVLKAGGVPLIDVKDEKRLTVSAVVSHALLNMICNPYVNRWLDAPSTSWAFEVCDPVEATQYRIVGGTPKYDAMVSNFVLPEFWNPNATPTARYDWVGTLHTPFMIGVGGYAITRESGAGSEKEMIFGDGEAGLPWRRTKEIVDGRSVLILKDNYIEPAVSQNQASFEEPSELDIDDDVNIQTRSTDADEILQETPAVEVEAPSEEATKDYEPFAPLPCEPTYVPPVVEAPPVVETVVVPEPEPVAAPTEPEVNLCPAQLAADDPDCPYDWACPVHKAKPVEAVQAAPSEEKPAEPEPIAEPVTEPDVASEVLPVVEPKEEPIAEPEPAPESAPKPAPESAPEPAPESAPITKTDRAPLPPLPEIEPPASGCADC